MRLEVSKEIGTKIKALAQLSGVSVAATVEALYQAYVKTGSVELLRLSFKEVVLTSVGVNRIQMIKLVREFTGLGLKDAKDLTDRVGGFPVYDYSHYQNGMARINGYQTPSPQVVPHIDTEDAARRFVERAAEVGGAATLKYA